MILSIIGVGLLGGSFALSLREKYPNVKFVGVDNSLVNQKIALAKGIVDEIVTLDVALQISELNVLATPVDAINKLLPYMLDHLPEGRTIMDLGSTKEAICQIADAHAKRAQFVAVHPMAGTENSGPGAAFKELLTDKYVIICDKEKSNAESLGLVETFLRDVGMKIYYMQPTEHDLHLAYVSHLSHISSFALGLTVLDKEKDEKAIFAMASTGFSSTVRLAKSSPQMWAPIFDQNKTNVSKALGDYIELLKKFKDAIDQHDLETSLDFMSKANDIRRVLAGIEKK
ncbi:MULTISPECIES: prephenate dehydrogenase [Dyadobacter]|uniref:Prephenate dehydrogenase n=1 Tax=Dyadobacter chenhuakuii TaxID=2909339 RepID=A0ABY4XJB8_9BACT|nr:MULTISPECIES: prephenate dehydrogenase [Dyadobacter]MCE7071750.1 prephenate dehydrogenase [Dyadobacter sp. CY327]MCF2496421.1 prephenate dehydrogenase [Dyadobacter chenhuakuii]USJ30478.1 prephenate dehydrogenase [Dyadobacter chenhuakuii]